MMKFISFAALLAFSLPAFASYDTEGYEPLRDFKAWGNIVEVYFQSNQEHQCSNGSHLTRFRADATKEHHVTVLLAAFLSGKGVSLSYSCDSNGQPMIEGIRLK